MLDAYPGYVPWTREERDVGYEGAGWEGSVDAVGYAGWEGAVLCTFVADWD